MMHVCICLCLYFGLPFFGIRISSLFVDFHLVSVFRGSPQGGSQHELGGLVWEDVEGQESFPVSPRA